MHVDGNATAADHLPGRLVPSSGPLQRPGAERGARSDDTGHLLIKRSDPMHELSLAHHLVQSVAEALRGQGSPRVLRVFLRVGALADVQPEALHFCYEIATRKTILEGSELVIRPVPVAIRCPACVQEVELADVNRFRCPACGTPSADLVRGRELEIDSVEVEDGVAAATGGGG